jgi:hypothetical protein
MKVLKANGYDYINGAICCFNNPVLLKKIVSKTYCTYGADFDQAALSYKQVEILGKLQAKDRDAEAIPFDCEDTDPEERIRLAEQTVLLFEKYHCPEKGFVSDKMEGSFISPQKYLGARRFLQHIG